MKIHLPLPDEIQGLHAHGQWVLAAGIGQPGQTGGVLNFSTDVFEDGYPDVETWAHKLEEFRASDELLMEFESPHVPGVCFLHRKALDLIVMTQPAWSRKVLPRQKAGGAELVDAGTGLPLVSRLRN